MTGRTKHLLHVVYLTHLFLLVIREHDHVDPYAPSICRHSGPGKVVVCAAL